MNEDKEEGGPLFVVVNEFSFAFFEDAINELMEMGYKLVNSGVVQDETKNSGLTIWAFMMKEEEG